MKLTSVEEYGLRCLVELGRGDEGESVTIAEMSRREGISAPNVAKIMRMLRRAGLVKSTRGQAGGYVLARKPADIKVNEVLAALGGRIYDQGFCDKHKGVVRLCTHLPDCSIRPVLRRVQEAVDQVLQALTLQSLLRSEAEVQASVVSPRAIFLPLHHS